MNASTIRDAPKRSRMSGTELGALVFITGFTIGIIALGWQIAANTVKANAYHRALPCASGASATSDCISYQTMRVVSKDLVDNDDMPDDYYLGLQDEKTTLSRVEVDGGLYEVVSIGSTVTVKFWRGDAMLVTGGGTRSGTGNHPDRENHRDWISIVIFGLGDWVLINGYLSGKRKRIRNSVPDAPWIATGLAPTRFQLWSVTETADTLTMTRSQWKSPAFKLYLLFGVMLLLTFLFGYEFLYPAMLSGDFLRTAIVVLFLFICLVSLWLLDLLRRRYSKGTAMLQFARGGASVLNNQQPLGAATRLFFEEQTTGDEQGHQYLNLVAEEGKTIRLGWSYGNDMASIRPFATHLAAFLDLPLEFTKEENPEKRS